MGGNKGVCESVSSRHMSRGSVNVAPLRLRWHLDRDATPLRDRCEDDKRGRLLVPLSHSQSWRPD